MVISYLIEATEGSLTARFFEEKKILFLLLVVDEILNFTNG